MVVFSVVVPIFNVENCLNKCIESILAQSYENFELICVNTHQKDRINKTLERYASIDKRVKIILFEEKKSVSAAKNKGISLAQGKYVTFVDSDDWVENNYLETIKNAFDKHSDVTSIMFDAYRYYETTHRRVKSPMLHNKEGLLKITPDNINDFNDYSWAKAYKLESIKENDINFPEGLTFEDGEFYFKYYAINSNAYMIENILYNYRVREGYVSTNVKIDDIKLEDMYQEMFNVKNFYKDHGLYEDYKRALLKMMNNRIQTGKNICNHYNTSVLNSIEILKDFDYPRECASFNEKPAPLFSIIVPIYNAEKYLEQCLTSIKFQTEYNFEVLCLDDCSEDSSYAIAGRFAKNDSRIRLFQHNKKRSVGATKNTALKLARGKYILCVNPTDWITNDCLQYIASVFKKYDVDSVWYKSKIYNEETQRVINSSKTQYYDNYPDGYINIDEKNIIDFNYYSYNKAYKRECILENQAIWTEDSIFEDIEFYFRYFLKSTKVYMIDKRLYYSREKNISTFEQCKRIQVLAQDLYKVLETVQRYLKKHKYYKQYKNAFFKLVDVHLNELNNYAQTDKQFLLCRKQFLDTIIDKKDC